MKTRNVYSVLVNAQNRLSVRGEEMRIEDLRDNVKEFIMNPQNLSNLAEKPTKAIISLKNDRGTQYETYLEVYNELKAAYNELRNDEALKRHGKEYVFCASDERRDIRNTIPLVISEAEPTAFGEEN